MSRNLTETVKPGDRDHTDNNLSAYLSFTHELKRFQSREEKILWVQLNEGKLKEYHFLRRHPVIVYKKDNTISFYIADFYCEEMRLVLELDTLKNNYATDNDKARDFIMKKLELQVLKISKHEINKNISSVLKKIRAFLRQKNTSPVSSDIVF